jgi:hypothetical protein
MVKHKLKSQNINLKTEGVVCIRVLVHLGRPHPSVCNMSMMEYMHVFYHKKEIN